MLRLLPPHTEIRILDDEDAKLAAWILTGLHHEAIRLAKKHKRMNEKELLILDKKMSDLEEENATELVDYLVARLGKHRGIEEDILLYEILSQLSSQQRMVITKVMLERHSEREVAQQLGISKQAVNRIKQRAIRRLRDEFYLMLK